MSTKNISDIKCGELRKSVTKKDIAERAASIKQHGLLQPIIINELDELVAGRTRFEAMKALGITELTKDQFKVIDSTEGQAVEFVENFQRKEMTLGEELKAIKAMSKTKTPKQIAREISKTETWVKRRLNLVNLSKSFQKQLMNNENPKAKIEHYEFIAAFSEEEQQKLDELYSIDFCSNMKKFKAQINDVLTKDISELPWKEEGCGECSFCKSRKEANDLFDEFNKNTLCSNASYLNQKYTDWINGIEGKLKVTESYYHENPAVITQTQFEEVEKGGEPAIIINGMRMGEEISVTVSNKEKKQGKISRKDLEKRLHTRRLRHVCDTAILPELHRLKDIVPLNNLILLYGVKDQLSGTWNGEKMEYHFGIEDPSILSIRELLEVETERKKDILWKAILKSVKRELQNTDEDKLKYVAKLIGLDFEEAFKEAAEQNKEPKSWQTK